MYRSRRPREKKQAGARLLLPRRTPLTTQALKASDPMPLRALRYMDFAILAIALPVFVAAGLPLLGWAGVAGAWIAQRAVQAAINKRARESHDPGTVAGLLTASMIARGWLVAGPGFLVGVARGGARLSGGVLA